MLHHLHIALVKELNEYLYGESDIEFSNDLALYSNNLSCFIQLAVSNMHLKSYRSWKVQYEYHIIIITAWYKTENSTWYLPFMCEPWSMEHFASHQWSIYIHYLFLRNYVALWWDWGFSCSFTWRGSQWAVSSAIKVVVELMQPLPFLLFGIFCFLYFLLFYFKYFFLPHTAFFLTLLSLWKRVSLYAFTLNFNPPLSSPSAVLSM